MIVKSAEEILSDVKRAERKLLTDIEYAAAAAFRAGLDWTAVLAQVSKARSYTRVKVENTTGRKTPS